MFSEPPWDITVPASGLINLGAGIVDMFGPEKPVVQHRLRVELSILTLAKARLGRGNYGQVSRHLWKGISRDSRSRTDVMSRPEQLAALHFCASASDPDGCLSDFLTVFHCMESVTCLSSLAACILRSFGPPLDPCQLHIV